MENNNNNINNENEIEPKPTPLIRERQLTNHSSNLSHSSINHIVNYNDNNIEDILKTPIKDSKNLPSFCSSLMSSKFYNSIQNNSIKPVQTDNKTFKIKIFKNSKKNIIKESILKNISSTDPKIKNFIDNSIDLIMINETKSIDRHITSIHEQNFNKINIQSQQVSRYFKKDFIYLNVNIISIEFL